jgi:HD-like signal output (HDOD) protein
LPALPKVAAAVFSLASDRNVTLEKVSDLVVRDQTLTGHLLKIANSAAFGSSFEIVSIKQAIFRLGMKLLSEIALSVTI